MLDIVKITEILNKRSTLGKEMEALQIKIYNLEEKFEKEAKFCEHFEVDKFWNNKCLHKHQIDTYCGCLCPLLPEFDT